MKNIIPIDFIELEKKIEELRKENLQLKEMAKRQTEVIDYLSKSQKGFFSKFLKRKNKTLFMSEYDRQIKTRE
jgi:hypothetical protein